MAQKLGELIDKISIHALREEGDGASASWTTVRSYFYPRPPRGGRLFDVLVLILHGEISIHALREEGDAESLRGRSKCQNFYPRPPRGGRQASKGRGAGRFHISIHALREEGDGEMDAGIHADWEFLSTPSARRATSAEKSSTSSSCNFYPRPPRGGRPGKVPSLCERNDFYPRPPRGGRQRDYEEQKRAFLFLSTPSARRATWVRYTPASSAFISIHALREEGDRGLRP